MQSTFATVNANKKGRRPVGLHPSIQRVRDFVTRLVANGPALFERSDVVAALDATSRTTAVGAIAVAVAAVRGGQRNACAAWSDVAMPTCGAEFGAAVTAVGGRINCEKRKREHGCSGYE